MGKRGPRPKPSVLKLLSGNPGGKKIAKEPKPRPIAPRCPAWLSAEAKKEWKRVAPELERCGLLTQLDIACLAAYCQVYGRWVSCERRLAKEGLDYETRNKAGEMYRATNPLVGIANRCLADIKRFCAEFGMSPAARSGMNIPNLPDPDDDGRWRGIL